MAAPQYSTRPLSDRTWLRPHARRAWSQFTVPWSQALDLLGYEVGNLAGKDLVIEVDVEEKDLRQDGRLRATARAASPAVVIAFTSKHGPLLYQSDRYAGLQYSSQPGMREPWQHNVYAVARTLEALRAVDRYGATRHAEQYAGWRQIGSGPAIVPDPPRDRTWAAGAIAMWAHPNKRLSELGDVVALILDSPSLRERLARRALRNTHPDTAPGVDPRDFVECQRAIAILRGEQ